MLYAFAFVLLTVSFFYLFVCVNEHGTGNLAKLKILVTQKFPGLLRAVAKRICGECFVRAIDRTAHYICFEPNPLVQLMYFACAFGGFYVYVTEGFPHIPNKYVSNYHKYTGTIIMILCYASYFAACWVDPGRISDKSKKSEVNGALRRYKYDNLIFQKKKSCRTCNFDKPARSKHCSMCGTCI